MRVWERGGKGRGDVLCLYHKLTHPSHLSIPLKQPLKSPTSQHSHIGDEVQNISFGEHIQATAEREYLERDTSLGSSETGRKFGLAAYSIGLERADRTWCRGWVCLADRCSM